MIDSIPNAHDWYTFDQVRKLRGVSARTLRRDLAGLSGSAKRQAPHNGRGRPPMLYHYTAFPELAAHHLTRPKHDLQQRGRPASQTSRRLRADTAPTKPPITTPTVGGAADPVSPDDLAIAQLRLTAIKEYELRFKTMTREDAAGKTAADWKRRAPALSVTINENLPGGHDRTKKKRVTLGAFRAGTLRKWHRSIYKGKKRLPDADALLVLAPGWKGSRGRKRTPIPEALLNLVWSLCSTNDRADVTKAVAAAREHWRGDFPELSTTTWQRRIREFDPRKSYRDLGHSIGRYRSNHNPDIEVDWLSLGYNQRWEVDDVQLDWYAHGSNPANILRPFAYVIMRCATRQWIALVTSETPITQEQLRTLVGCAFASDQGGLPEELRLEHGTVAGDRHLEWLCETLGVKVTRNQFDNGAVHNAAVEDPARGHPQGKAILESNNRRQHNLEWDMPLQVGREERHTAPPRYEILKRQAAKLAEKNEFLVLPTPQQWHRMELEKREEHNNTPHSGLPKIVDPATGKPRHMTPNERAVQLKDEEIRTMDPRYLPLFYVRGERVKVTRNGFRLHNFSFGRFDDELKTLDQVTAYVDPANPEAAFVVELGRCVELYEKERVGGSSQFERQKHQEKKARNQYRAAVDAAMDMIGSGAIMVDAVQVTRNPFPERISQVSRNELLDSRADALGKARQAYRARKQQHERKFDVPEQTSPAQGEAPASQTEPRRRGILAQSDRIRRQLATLSGSTQPTEESACQFSLQ